MLLQKLIFFFSNRQLYNFGETVSIPFWTESWRPDSFLDKILLNRRNGLHTLCLLGTTARYFSRQIRSSLVAVLRIRDVHPGSWIRLFPSRIQALKDSGSRVKKIPYPRTRIRIRIKELKYFNPKKLFLSS